MRYLPSLPRKNDNVLHNHPLKEFALLSAGLVLIFTAIYVVLGFLVDLTADTLSLETETALFRAINTQFDFAPQTGGEEQQHLQKIADDLHQCSNLPFPVRVHVVQSDDANAIALPGGNITVLSGLLTSVTTEKGLAFVLAHELGHYSNRDHLRHLGRSLVLYALSALITGVDSGISQLLAPSSMYTQAQYSQARESLADQTALDTVFCRYGTIEGVTEFFVSLEETDRGKRNGLSRYFVTHPMTEKRIADLEEYAVKKGYSAHHSHFPSTGK